MSLIEELELLWRAIDAGEITEEDAAHRVVQWTEGWTALEGARELLSHRGQVHYVRHVSDWLKARGEEVPDA